MNSYLKHYKIILKTIAPVFIGSGKQISKKEYVFDGKKIYVVDEKKLIDTILKRNLIDDFTQRISENSFDLKFWLDKNGMRDYEQLTAYKLSGIENVDNKRSLKDIQECVKNAYGKPYIPASSLKGALRTVILWNEIYKASDLLGDIRRELNSKVNDKTLKSKYLKKELGAVSNELEKRFFVEKMVEKNVEFDRKIMQGLIIGDSKPLSLDDIVLCEKIDINVNGRLGKSRMPMLRECIRPGTEVEFDLTIEPAVLQYTADDLDDMFKGYASDYYDIITKMFPYGDDDENAIFIGGGSGFFSKTVVYSLFEKAKAVDFTRKYLSKTTPGVHKHENDIKISPHMQKCTRCNGKMYEMGKCEIKIVEI